MKVQIIDCSEKEPMPLVRDASEDEAAAILSRWAVEESALPMKEWIKKISDLDAKMPRYVEDLIDRDGTDGLPQALIDAYTLKKKIRSERP
jgi:hypothetical protein